MMNRQISIRKPVTYALRLAALIAFAAVGTMSSAYSDNGPASQLFRSPQSTAQVVSAVSGTGDLAAIPLALHIVLQPGWKTYWRAPGDAGYPPQVDVSGSTNVAKVELLWPVPHRFELFGLQTFGYGGEVAFPLMVTPQQPGAAVSVTAKISLSGVRADLRAAGCDPRARPAGRCRLADGFRAVGQPLRLAGAERCGAAWLVGRAGGGGGSELSWW